MDRLVGGSIQNDKKLVVVRSRKKTLIGSVLLLDQPTRISISSNLFQRIKLKKHPNFILAALTHAKVLFTNVSQVP